MSTQRVINDTGLDALKYLSREEPEIFLQANPDNLISRVKSIAETDEIWGNILDLRGDLSALNEIKVHGPETDSRYAPLVRHALRYLPPAEGLNEYRWATINCFVIPKYVTVRWSNVLPNDSKRHPAYVERHWLEGKKVDARQDNAIARLWWLVEFAERASMYSNLYDKDDFLNAMANNVELYHQFLYRTNLISRSKVLAAVYETYMDDNEYLIPFQYDIAI